MLRFFKRNRQENLEHTQDAVKPSRERWFGRILNVLRSSKLDDSVWEELEEIFTLSDRIVVMYEGKIVADGVEADAEKVGLLMTGGSRSSSKERAA